MPADLSTRAGEVLALLRPVLADARREKNHELANGLRAAERELLGVYIEPSPETPVVLTGASRVALLDREHALDLQHEALNARERALEQREATLQETS